MGEYWLVSVDTWDPSMNEDDETYYAQIKLMNLSKDVFSIQDLEESADMEADVPLGRSNM